MPEKSLLKAKRDIRKRRVGSAEGHLRQAVDALRAVPADTAMRHREECVNVTCELARVEARAGHVAEAERLLGFALETAGDGCAVASGLQVRWLRALLFAHCCRFSDARAECARAQAMVRDPGVEAVWGPELQATVGLIERIEGDRVARVKVPPIYVDSLSWESRFLHNDLHLARVLADAAAVVSDLRVRDRGPFAWEVELCVRFEAPARLTELTQGEEWKRAQLKLTGQNPAEFPGLILGLQPEEEVLGVEARGARGDLIPASADARPWTIFLPDSYPRLGETPLDHLTGETRGDVLPLCKRYRYLLGKGVVVSWAAVAGMTYRLRVVIEGYPRDGELAGKRERERRLSLFVPGGRVHVGRAQISPADLDGEGPRLEAWGPFVGQDIREADEEILHQLLRASTPSLQVSAEAGPPRQPLAGGRLLREGRLTQPVALEDFSLLVLSWAWQPSDPVAVAVRPLRSSLPVAVYPHLRVLEGWKGFGVLVYQLANFGKEAERLRVRTDLLGWSHPQVEEVTLPPGSIRQIRHAPELLPGPKDAAVAAVRWEVVRVRDGVLLESGSAPIYFVGRSQLPRVLMSPEDGRRRDLSPFVAAYVIPGDPAVQAAVAEAAEYLPGDPPMRMSGYPPAGTAEEPSQATHAQVEALFRYFKEARGLRCTGEEIVWGTGKGWEEQSLRLPRETLEAGEGHCLDVSLLMASCCECLGLRPWICLTRGHAFVGFEPHEDRDDVAFLETAFLDAGVPGGYREALEEGHRLFQSEFDRGVPGRRWCRGISLIEARSRWQIAPWEG
ncbi:MAG: hypothetical protein ACE5IQ_09840 [Candidatus Methylomirabilales bacterium]